MYPPTQERTRKETSSPRQREEIKQVEKLLTLGFAPNCIKLARP